LISTKNQQERRASQKYEPNQEKQYFCAPEFEGVRVTVYRPAGFSPARDFETVDNLTWSWMAGTSNSTTSG
jgi:hypothetical protein